MLKCNNLSDLFKAIRDRKGWSQAQLADYLGIAQTYVSAIERGERVPSNKIQHKLTLLKKECDLFIELEDEKTNSEVVVGHEPPMVSLEDYISLRENLAAWKGKAEAFQVSYDKLLNRLGESIISIEKYIKKGTGRRISEHSDVQQVRRS